MTTPLADAKHQSEARKQAQAQSQAARCRIGQKRDSEALLKNRQRSHSDTPSWKVRFLRRVAGKAPCL
jgi:hypothetical protein